MRLREAARDVKEHGRETPLICVILTSAAEAIWSVLDAKPDTAQPSPFSYVQTTDFLPADDPLRRIRSLANTALKSMEGALMVSYLRAGRPPGIAPKRSIRALLLQALYSSLSKRQLFDQLRCNMRFRWFVGLSLDDVVWDATSFAKIRQRFIDSAVTGRLLDPFVDQAWQYRMLSEQHCCVDGTLIEAWVSMGSYHRQADNDEPPSGPPDFNGKARPADTHECKTDPDARLYRKARGQAAQSRHIDRVLTHNRYALIVDAEPARATGTAGVDAAFTMLGRRRRLTVRADKGYVRPRFATELGHTIVTPNVAQQLHRRRLALGGETTRHTGYAQSIHARYRVETPLGWGRCAWPLRQIMRCRLGRVPSQAKLIFASYNLRRLVALGGGMGMCSIRSVSGIPSLSADSAHFDHGLISKPHVRPFGHTLGRTFRPISAAL